jgi:hypothetical protein
MPGDIIYLHFSCHGQPFEDMNGDEADGWDESYLISQLLFDTEWINVKKWIKIYS